MERVRRVYSVVDDRRFRIQERGPPSLITRRKIRPYKPPKLYAQKPDASIVEWIEENLNKQVVNVEVIGSSGWASQYCYVTRDEAYKKIRYFIKTTAGSKIDMFQSEALGLNALHSASLSNDPWTASNWELDTGAVVVPEVKHVGTTPGGFAFMVADYLDLQSGVSSEELGRSIALMHLAEPEDEKAKNGAFGFPVDNTIGGTPQPNGWMDSWVDFFRERRLRHQLRLAGDPNLTKMGEELCAHLELFFEGVEVRPSVLHGDLWAGNYAAVDGRPAIFDPATYYGHHEAEFGMSWCANFSPSFWKAYHEVIPKAPGFEERQLIYKLYHYLNHYNLFGSGYYQQCQSILATLTRDVLRDA